mmetsp:Transcript_6239/g.18444  ORF Transcript_6239/g.18444 Transcript_6239/m.18444 type:complete len:277 (-) Transcript_6239:972-1802(-)
MVSDEAFIEMEVVGFVASTLPRWRGGDGGWHGGSVVLHPRPSKIRLEDFVHVQTVEEQRQATAVAAELVRSDLHSGWVQAAPVAHVRVASVEVGGGRLFGTEARGVCQRHLRAETSGVGSVRSASVLGTITSVVHGAVGVDTEIVFRTVVVPRDSDFLAQGIVQVRQGRTGIGLELELDVTVLIDEDEGRLDVEATKVNLSRDLDEVAQRYSTRIRIGCSGVKDGNVGRILVDDGANGVTKLLSDQPTVIGSERSDVGTVTVRQEFKVELRLEGCG